MLEVKNITKKFKDFIAVENISFTANPGEVVGLLGENGAGKTTTMRMIATMLQISQGEIKVNGLDAEKEPEKVRGSIGILFGGDVGLYDKLTARENIMYFAALNGLSEKEAKENTDKVLREFEMTDYADKLVGKFSRGMKQKVAISRTIVHNPPVILMDEPSTGLDVSATRLVQDFLLKCKKENKTIIFSSHSMAEVSKLCDRVIIIHKGKLVDSGTIEELKIRHKNEDLEELFIDLTGGYKNGLDDI